MSTRYDISYVKSQKKKVQGSKSEIYRQYGKEWDIMELGEGNGNWLLTKKSDVLLNGVSYRDFVLNHYNSNMLTPKLVNQFSEDIENGNINIDKLL